MLTEEGNTGLGGGTRNYVIKSGMQQMLLTAHLFLVFMERLRGQESPFFLLVLETWLPFS